MRETKPLTEPAEVTQPKKAPTQVNKTQGKTYSFTDSAEKVLEQFGKKRPMHYRAITEKAMEMGWLLTEGKTPEASMYAQILADLDDKGNSKFGREIINVLETNPDLYEDVLWKHLGRHLKLLKR